MLEIFIIDGNKVEIEVLQKTFKAELVDVTSYTDQWKNFIHSGFRFLIMQVKTIGYEETFTTYQIIGENEGVLILKSIENG